MRSGTLRHVLYVQDVTGTNTGGITAGVWALHSTRRCRFEPIRGSERFEADQVYDNEPALFYIRNADDITTKMRLVYNEQVYGIDAITPDDNKNEVALLTYLYPKKTIPVLVSGPTATPAETTSLIEWTTDTPAYHRVRYKTAGGEWTTTDWTETASSSASVTLTGL